MELDEFLEGETLTGRQAIIVFFGFLLLVILAGIMLVLLSDFFH